MNEIQVLQTALNYARSMEGLRQVERFSAQRLEQGGWGVFLEGANKEQKTLTIKLRVEASGSLYKV